MYQNLEAFTIISDTSSFKIPREGDLVNEYKPLRNLQSDSGEIGYFTTSKLDYSIENPVKIEVQPSYDGSVNLILNDDENPPLLINSRFSVEENNTFSIPEHSGTTETNLYSENTIELDTKLYKTITKIPHITYLGLSINGKMKVGTYNFYFKYSDIDGNETDFIAESGIVTCHIGGINDPKSIRMGMQDEDSKKMIKFKISNIDIQYDYLKVYYTRTTSDNSGQDITTAHSIDNKFLIKNDELSITITGFENITDVSIEEINPIYALAGTVKAQAQAQNMLFFGNINKPNIPYEELADLSLRIVPKITNDQTIGNINQNYIDKSGLNSWEYYNTKNIYNYLGYWPEEYYRVGIVYLMNDYTLSPVFNTRGIDLTNYDNIDFKYSDFALYDENEERKYIEYDSEGYITEGNNYENNKGVIKFPKKEVINPSDKTSNGVYPIGINFEFQTANGDTENVITELKKYTKGFFFVRQKRTPTILAQGCTIGKTTNDYGNLPVIPISSTEAIIEGFLNEDKKLENTLFTLDSSKYEIKGLISPEVELREQLFNQLLTSSSYVLTNAKEQSSNKIQYVDYSSPRNYYLLRDINEDSSNDFNKSSILTIINDNMKLTTDGTNYFSARAGEAEQAWDIVDIVNNWKKTKAKTINNSSSFIRGSFGTYVGIGNANLEYGKIVNIRPNGFEDTDTYKTNMFKLRFEDNSYYSAISDRQSWDDIDNSLICYRGDCYIGNFSHRINRNFIDPDLPTASNITDLLTWKNNFYVHQDYPDITNSTEVNNFDINSENYINRALPIYKQNKNDSSDIVEPTDADYDAVGSGLTTWLGGDTKYKVKGCNKINRADVNAVELGHWFTFKTMANINVSMRDIDKAYPEEESLFGHPRGFYPLQKMDMSSIYKLPESKIINGATNNTLSNKFNFLVPNVPFIKNKFNTRILYSNIHITDAFSNGYRVFIGNHYRDLPKTYGSLTSLIELSGNLVAVMENGVLLIPINERAVAAEGSGGTVYINTSNVLPENPRVLSSNFGSIWKESCIVTINTVYGIDTTAKKIWRTNGETFEILSDLKVQKFLNDNINLKESDKNSIVGLKNVKTHYNAFKGDIMFTFYNNDNIWNLCYNEKLGKFITRYSWTPSYSENINNIFFSFDLTPIQNIENTLVYGKDHITIYAENISENYYSLTSVLNKNLPYIINIGKVLWNDGIKEPTECTIAIVDSNENILYSNNILVSDELQTIKFISPNIDNLELRLYSGKINKTNNIGIKFKNIMIYQIDYNNLTIDNYLWKHGQAGIYDLQGNIFPTNWYDKQELFEFEFIVKDPPVIQKIFDNLRIISNKSQPQEFEFEVVGEGYDWYNYKEIIQLLNDNIIYDSNTNDYVYNNLHYITYNLALQDSYKDYLILHSEIKKLPYIKRVRSTSATWEDNTTNVWLIKDEQLSEERIHTNQLGNNIKITGRVKGNMEYLEDFWNVEIRPINFKYAYLDNNELKFTSLKQSKIRDKYIKIRVRYSGEDLTIIQAIKTLSTISYA